jgi:hypothetical protein
MSLPLPPEQLLLQWRCASLNLRWVRWLFGRDFCDWEAHAPRGMVFLATDAHHIVLNDSEPDRWRRRINAVLNAGLGPCGEFECEVCAEDVDWPDDDTLGDFEVMQY